MCSVFSDPQGLRGAVVFDLDGTLTDTMPATFHCFGEAVAPVLGRRPSDAEIFSRMGAADYRIIADWVGPEHAEAAVKRLYDCYESAYRDVVPWPGIAGLLEALHRTARPLGLFTGRGRPSTDRLLEAMNLDRVFAASVTGEETAHPKPAPDGLLRVLELMEARPEEAVYVGDTGMDARAAEAAGVAFIGVAWASPEAGALREGGGYPVVSSVDELRDLLR
jgi:HAD superfamily hydrolase (TIGR01509 family)